MKRKEVLEHIKVEYARHGECTDKAMQLYAENRVSYAAFEKAAKTGIEIYATNATCPTSIGGLVDRALKPARPFEDVAGELGI